MITMAKPMRQRGEKNYQTSSRVAFLSFLLLFSAMGKPSSPAATYLRYLITRRLAASGIIWVMACDI